MISVLIYSEHEPVYLKRCLASLTPPPLSESNLEILVLDSGTSPQRAESAERLVRQLGKPFRWLASQGETRRTALYNQAIQASCGDTVVFTHDDAYFPKDWLPLLTAPLRDPLTGCASGEDQVPLDERPFLISLDYVLKNPFGSGGMRRGHGIRFGYFTPRDWNMAFPKRVLLEVGLFDPSFDACAEAELVLRIREAGYKIAYVPESKVFHTRETSLRKITRTNFKRGLTRSRLARKTGVLRHVPHFLGALLTITLPILGMGALLHQPYRLWLLVPVMVYVGALSLMGLHAFMIWRSPPLLFWTPLLVMSQHFGHGMGYLSGFLTMSRTQQKSSLV